MAAPGYSAAGYAPGVLTLGGLAAFVRHSPLEDRETAGPSRFLGRQRPVLGIGAAHHCERGASAEASQMLRFIGREHLPVGHYHVILGTGPAPIKQLRGAQIRPRLDAGVVAQTPVARS